MCTIATGSYITQHRHPNPRTNHTLFLPFCPAPCLCCVLTHLLSHLDFLITFPHFHNLPSQILTQTHFETVTSDTGSCVYKVHIHIPMALSNSPILFLSLLFILRDCQNPFEVRSMIKTPKGFVLMYISLYSFKIVAPSLSAPLLTLSELFRLSSCWLP